MLYSVYQHFYQESDMRAILADFLRICYLISFVFSLFVVKLAKFYTETLYEEHHFWIKAKDF